ncbi:unnamed protein product [Dibothriocephalus latus]|uniref:Uncharacterized protein n=1 Tax=Dibothriocephalus latus TaxID=60516 RepID=A0A3P6Q3G8_DIBLA|nr:unnamed protein product [Dibothriocephalus latus]
MISNFSKKLKQIGLTEYPKLLFTRGLKGIRLGKKDASEGSSSKTESCLRVPRVTQCATHRPAWNDPQQQLEGELLDTVEFIGKTLRDLACSLHHNNEEMLKIVKRSTVSPANESRSPCSFNWDPTCANQCPRKCCTTVNVPSDRCLTTLTPTSLQTTEEKSVWKGPINCAARNRPKELTSDEFLEIRQLLENLGQEFCAHNKQINEILSANACRQSVDFGLPEIEPIMQRLDQVCVEIMEMKQRGDIKTESGCSPHPLETALVCTLEQLNTGLATLGQSSCEILSKLEHLHGKIATPEPPPEMPTTLPEEASCASEKGEPNLDAALCELKTRVQNLEEQNGVTLQALAGLQKVRPDSRAKSSISGTQLVAPSLPESATPSSVSLQIPKATFKEAGIGSDPAVLETLGELKSLLQVLGQDLDVIANRRNSPECSMVGQRICWKICGAGC